MCGIAGIISPSAAKFSAADLLKMTSALAHRGPDGYRHWTNTPGNVLLGHRRLAVIDLRETAAQPMHYLGRYSIVHNGEIYNYKELRKDLRQNGYSFQTESDTEVILAAYDCYGAECLAYFDGMFAFAIWDEKEKTFFAARDRFGEKPFYYAQDASDNSFYFASEIKALWAVGVPRIIDDSMLLNFLSIGLTSHPLHKHKTFYKNIQCIPAGHYLQIHAGNSIGQPLLRNYWNPSIKENNTLSLDVATQQLREYLNESVALRMRSDVLIGTSLSGGLDSSSVVASIHQQPHSAQYQSASFTAGFKGFEKDETVNASLVADTFALQQHIVHPTATDFAGEIESLIKHHEEPISSSSVYAQYKVFEMARLQGVTVLLDGQGADELLAGYTRYYHWYLQELLRRGKFSLYKKEKKKLSENDGGLQWNGLNLVAAAFPAAAARQLQKRTTEKILHHPGIHPGFAQAHYDSEASYKPVIRCLNDILYYQARTSGLDELLRYADKNSMAHGREVRLPFLSHKLAEFAFSLPANWKIRNGYSKWILRKAMEPTLPSSIVWHKKKIAFEPPQQQWMAQPRVLAMIHQAKEKLVQEKILDSAVLKQKIQPHSAYAADCSDWRYLVCGILY